MSQAGEIRVSVLTRVRHSSRRSGATQSYQCVQYFRQCIDTVVRLPEFGIFNVPTDVDACDIAHVGCTDTVRPESAPKVSG